jgi:uncharacterized membrane protein
MKNLLKESKKLLFIFIFTVTCFSPQALLAAEKINNFEVTFEINTDSSVDISEEITYSFGNAERHGIRKEIPLKYKSEKGNLSLDISNISVTDENGDSYKFSRKNSQGNFSLKIGDADKLVTGEKTYIINYTIKKALNYFDNHDEFYWNAIGNGWDIPIENISAKVILPKESSEIRKDCFIGRFGSQEKCFSEVDNNKEIIFWSRDILANEGVTLVVGFPKNIVTPPSLATRVLETIKDNMVVALPLIVLLIMFSLWRKKGKDPKGRGTIIAQYDAPKGLTPIEIGTLVDERVQSKDVSAQIIHLAVRGYLKIKKSKKKILLFNATDYEFEKLKDEKGLKNEFDRGIMKGLFAGNKIGKKVKLSSLKQKFYKNFSKIIKNTYRALVEKNYFPKSPKIVTSIYLTIGVLVAFVSFFVISPLGWIGAISFAISGIIIIIFSFIMPVKTKKGVLAYEQILGLKKYLTVAEKDRIYFHNAPSKNPAQFEKFLPYAMALGVHKEWSEQFKDIYQGSPDWYTDGSPSTFSSIALANSLAEFSASANTAIASSPSSASSGGSGFSGGGSGGGFGGGGGGSW